MYIDQWYSLKQMWIPFDNFGWKNLCCEAVLKTKLVDYLLIICSKP